MNLLTNEWNDGIIGALTNEASLSPNEKYWILLDGPVDPLWVENLNTVLDDNRMLCLPNGQRIKIPLKFMFLFEVSDLKQASPATVSRCGMVYCDKKILTW
jgi:dynein heavy chain